MGSELYSKRSMPKGLPLHMPVGTVSSVNVLKFGHEMVDDDSRHSGLLLSNRNDKESVLKSALSMFFRDDNDGSFGEKTEKLMAMTHGMKPSSEGDAASTQAGTF